MNIYTVRHGQTDWNNKRLLQGNTNTDLNDEGIKQAYVIKDKLKNINFDICYSSPLARAYHTAKIIMDNENIRIIPGLEERDYGLQEGKPIPSAETLEKAWDLKTNITTSNIESISSLLARTKRIKDYLLQQDYENILIVSHGSTLKAFHFNMVGYDSNTDLMSFKMENCEVNKYTIEDNIIKHTKEI